MATKPHERIFSLVLALLFFVTSVGAGLGVILKVRDEQKKENATASASQALKAAQNNITPTPIPEDNKVNPNKLQGTKLANFTPVDSVPELQKIDIVIGTGAEASASSTVVAHYTGALAKDGTIFESSHDSQGDKAAEFPLSGVIKGWTQGVPGMKVGGKRRLVIPSALAYGAAGGGTKIPANADLVFDIELTAVK